MTAQHQLASSQHYTTLPRMHISVSVPKDDMEVVAVEDVPVDGLTKLPVVGVSTAHSMTDMRQHQFSSSTSGAPNSKVLERSSLGLVSSDTGFLSGPEGILVAIETSVGHKRPSSHSSLSSSSSDERLNTSSHRTFREMRTKIKPVVVGAPDLVMDLPVSSLSSSPRDHVSSSSSPSSSPSLSPCPRPRSSSPQHYHSLDIPPAGEDSSSTPSPDMTAAECFAKQNQSTLKKTPVTKTSTVIISGSTDAQTQTLLQAGKSSLSVMKSTSLDVSQLGELKITEGDDFRSDHRRPSGAAIMQQLSVDLNRTPTTFVDVSFGQSPGDGNISGSGDGPLVEVRSAAGPLPITPNTPRLAARYLQAVAAASGTPVSATGVTPKPQVRVKPTVMKKPSISPADSDSEQPSK